MSNVVEFRPKNGNKILIDIGRFVISTNPVELLGEPRFFVDVMEADGGRITMFDSESHDEAIEAARELSADWGAAPIVDRSLA